MEAPQTWVSGAYLNLLSLFNDTIGFKDGHIVGSKLPPFEWL